MGQPLKRFGVRLYVRFALVLLVLVSIAWLVAFTNYVLLPVFGAVLAILLIVELIGFIRRTNKELSRFLFSIQHNDFTAAYIDTGLESGFPELANALRSIADKFRQNRIEKESYLHFLDAMVAEVRVGLMAINSSNEVRIMNQTAVQLLDLPNLKEWKRFKEKAPDFANAAEALSQGERKLVTVHHPQRSRVLALTRSSVILVGEKHTIYTFYDLRNELEAKELESYNRLISILTHEIMNSVTPVSSLSETMEALLQHPEGRTRTPAELSGDDLQDLNHSIATIRRRSEGMLRFVQEYRKVAKVPDPQLQEVQITTLFDAVATLVGPELEKASISLECSVDPPPLSIYIDRNQIEQVLLNLVRNAQQALEETDSPHITLRAYVRDSHKIIEVADNGPGVPASVVNSIFVPFFTTKPQGSGIGLSLSQQVMQKHKGSMNLQAAGTAGATFVLQFRF